MELREAESEKERREGAEYPVLKIGFGAFSEWGALCIVFFSPSRFSLLRSFTSRSSFAAPSATSPSQFPTQLINIRSRLDHLFIWQAINDYHKYLKCAVKFVYFDLEKAG